MQRLNVADSCLRISQHPHRFQVRAVTLVKRAREVPCPSVAFQRRPSDPRFRPPRIVDLHARRSAVRLWRTATPASAVFVSFGVDRIALAYDFIVHAVLVGRIFLWSPLVHGHCPRPRALSDAGTAHTRQVRSEVRASCNCSVRLVGPCQGRLAILCSSMEQHSRQCGLASRASVGLERPPIPALRRQENARLAGKRSCSGAISSLAMSATPDGAPRGHVAIARCEPRPQGRVQTQFTPQPLADVCRSAAPPWRGCLRDPSFPPPMTARLPSSR